MTKRLKDPRATFKLLDSRYLISIGRISYGMYLYHLYIPKMRNYIFNHIFKFQLPPANGRNIFIYILFDLIVVAAIARLSWSLIEQAILKYKKHFADKKLPEQQTISLLQPVVD